MGKKVIIGLVAAFIMLMGTFLGFFVGKKNDNKQIKLESNRLTQKDTTADIEEKITEDKKQNELEKKNIVKKIWTGPVENIFFHPLISNIEVAFKGDWRTNNFDDWFVTVEEFNKILESLYKKEYIIVDINNVYEEYEEKGEKRIRRKELLIPEGKKPIIVSIDDLSYNDGMRGGTSDKLIIDSNGEIATLAKGKNGEEKISKDNEVITIMNQFIKDHPDFSFDGAKGTIALTGYQGILGYATNFEAPNHEKEREQAQKVVDKLKKEGWTFASHSYGHNPMNKITLEKLKKDADKWEKEVESIVGDTQIFIYPHGTSVESKDLKFKYLQSKGFKVFYSVGKEPYEKILKDTCAVLGDRMAVDGIALRTKRERFMRFFDGKEVIDLSVRPNREVKFD